MKFDPQKHHRRSIRLQGYDYTQPGAYFVTMVTHGRDNLFGEIVDGEMRLNALGQIALREWQRLPRRFNHVELDEFVIMPNHVHVIIVILDDGSRGTADFVNGDNPQIPCRAPTTERFGKPVEGSIPTIIRSYKSAVALRVNYIRATPGVPVWQRNYYEHTLRDENEWRRICEYILANPAQWDSDDENPER